MRNIPIEVLLSWPTPNYDNPVTRGNALVIVNSIFISLVICVVSLRLYTRIVVKRWFGSDDVFIVLALIFTIGLTALVLLANGQYGWNRHVYDIPFNKIEGTLKIAMAGKILFTSAATSTRLSLLFFYYRLVSDTPKRWFVWGIHFNIFFSTGIFLTFIFQSIFQCSPVSNYWTFGYTTGRCLNEGTITLTAGIINCTADLLCTILPMPMVLKLQMPLRQRVAVVILFSLGFIVTIAGIVRTWYIYKSLIAEYDITWYAYPLWIAAAVEIDLGVICASAPVLRPLLSKLPFSVSTRPSKLSTRRVSGTFAPKVRSSQDTSGSTLQGSGGHNSQYYKSATDSNRRSEQIPIKEDIAGETAHEHPHEYELDQWRDVERLGASHMPGPRESQDAILGNQESARNGKVRDGTLRRSQVLTAANLKKIEIDMQTKSQGNWELDRVSTKSSEAVGPITRVSVQI